MNLLLKIYLETLNLYDIDQMIKIINATISNKKSTKLILMLNNKYDKIDLVDSYFLQDKSISKIINYKLDDLEWDIFLPITIPSITKHNFDNNIIKIYKKKYPDLDGVLWLNDDTQNELNTYPVIGRKYYDKFGYIYNPSYNNKNYDKEFTEVLKLSNKFTYVNDIFIKPLDIKSDDDKIYELRKKYNFSI
jgi:hypothetical protein